MDKKERKGHAKISIDEYDMLKNSLNEMYDLQDRVKYLEKSIDTIIYRSLEQVKGRLDKTEIHYDKLLNEPIIIRYSEMDRTLRIYLKDKL